MLLISGAPAFWFTKFFIRDSLQLYRAQSWPEVTAVIRVSVSDTLPENEGEGHGPSALYERVEYGFTVGDTEYLSRRVAPFERWNSGKAYARYKEGARVSAWVNPENPFESVLERQKQFGFFGVLALTIVFDLWFIFGLLTAFAHERYLKAFLGHVLVILPAGIGIAAVVADEVVRTRDWWLAVGGFLGAIASFGLATVISVWTRRATIVGLAGFLAGVICIIAGVVKRE